MPVSTTSAAVYITPVVFKTLVKHYKLKQRKVRHGEPRDATATDDVLYDEAYHIVKAFIELGTKNTMESLQAFTNTHVPAPFWAAVAPVLISLSSCNRAADVLIDWFGPEDLAKVVGGERWWQVRGLDGIDAEWVTERKFLNGDNIGEDKKNGSYNETIRKMEKLESVMLYVHGGGYYWGSINTHRYQIIRYARKFKGRAFAVNYRKAPQYPWPCPLHDVLAAYFYLTHPPEGAPHKAIDPKKMVFAGDSAGAALCLTALTVLRDMGIPQPAGAILISPWVDLTHSFKSVMENKDTDIMPPHGFVHRPSMLWPVHPVPDGERARVIPTQTNGPPPPGHADTLAPSPGRTVEHDVQRMQAAQQDMTVEQVQRESAVEEGIQSQQEMLETAPPNESPSGSSRTQVSGNVRETEAEDRDPDIDLEELERWEPKPPKVLMEDPNAQPLEIRSQIQQYATNEQLTHPLVSPILQGSLGDLCPLYILAGDGELLRDEIIHIAHRAAHPEEYPVRKGVIRDGRRQRENAGKFTTPTKVHLQIYDGMPHVLTVFTFTDSAKYAYRSIAQFVRHVTTHPQDHIALNPFPELHRPECKVHIDNDSDVEIEDKVQRKNGTVRRWLPGRARSEMYKKTVQDEDTSGADLYRANQDVVAEEIKTDDVDKSAANSMKGEHILEKLAPDAPEDVPHVHMIRERVDIRGRARPMEHKEDIPALCVRPSDVGVIKEAPVRRWVIGQEMVDKKYARLAEKVVRKRRKLEARAERMLADARDKGLVLERETTDVEDVERPEQLDGAGEGRSKARVVRSRSSASVAISVNSTTNGRINEDRRWGPLDLDNERPPPSAIAGRRDTPEALALLKKSVYHNAPTTHKTVPKMKAMQTLRATFDPDDSPVKAPKQSVSEQQKHTSVMPVHGLSIWNSILTLFMKKTSQGARAVGETVTGSPAPS
ncbi:alpha/beta-hydrolase [Auriscalpium vulgare]|uniref:Alpha/beta-hydrolase n=1 Tax=Auriscalpium vulgare TaxID=40419 RepID=A0ACB8RLR5_9AGAM|nr:alpha/beta-hydrolase [Auriscalpium vulgare]